MLPEDSTGIMPVFMIHMQLSLLNHALYFELACKLPRIPLITRRKLIPKPLQTWDGYRRACYLFFDSSGNITVSHCQ